MLPICQFPNGNSLPEVLWPKSILIWLHAQCAIVQLAIAGDVGTNRSLFAGMLTNVPLTRPQIDDDPLRKVDNRPVLKRKTYIDMDDPLQTMAIYRGIRFSG